MGAECKGRPQQILCYRVMGKTGILDLEERWRATVRVLAFLAPVPEGTQGMPARVGGWDKAMSRGRREKLERKIYVIHWRWGR